MQSYSKRATAMLRSAALTLLGVAWVFGSSAEELIYQPINPSFGGSPLNGNWLLEQATAQDTFEDPDARSDDLAGGSDLSGQSELDQFNETLERIALSRIANQLVDSFLAGDTSFLETENFIIESTTDPVTGETTITTTDKSTGSESTFVLGSTP